MIEWQWRDRDDLEWYTSNFSMIISDDDFEYIMYRIDNVVYTKPSPEFYEAVDKIIMWQELNK